MKTNDPQIAVLLAQERAKSLANRYLFWVLARGFSWVALALCVLASLNNTVQPHELLALWSIFWLLATFNSRIAVRQTEEDMEANEHELRVALKLASQPPIAK